MIDIKDKRKCTGCGACIAACPHKAIRFAPDRDGCRYPEVDKEICTGCGLCDRTCPMQDPRHGVPSRNEKYVISCYAGQHKDRSVLGQVSSGGAFWALACAVLDQSGVVYGAVQKDVDRIFHIRADEKKSAAEMRRSKYLQSDAEETYARVRKDLRDGREVLFSGTPCQVAALNCFLKKDYPNLYTVEVVCHGVPVPLAWKKYREETEQKKQKKMSGLVFRDKSRGWRRNQYRIIYEDGSVEKEASVKHLFHQGYLMGLLYRPSCGTCPFASLPRTADVTLADFWKYKGDRFSGSRDAGVSLLLANNDQGEKLIRLSGKYLITEGAEKKQAVSSCRHLTVHPSDSCWRNSFLEQLRRRGYHAAAKKYFFRARLEYAAGMVFRKINKIYRQGS